MSLAIDIEARRRVQIKEYEGKKYMAIDCDDLFDSQKNEIKLDAEKKGWIYLGRHEKFPDRLLFTRNKKDELVEEKEIEEYEPKSKYQT